MTPDASPPPSATQRWVLHLDMDSFFASVEQLTRPTLRGRPVLVGGAGQRGVVAGASYEARAYGAHSAMPMHQARRLVGARAVVVRPRGVVYGLASARVFQTVRAVIPVIEQLSMDEAFGEPEELIGATAAQVGEFCARLRERVLQETGLVASVGAGSGKQIAKIASDLAKPRGQRVIARAEQQEVLEALPVRSLWGIGPVANERLQKVGVETIGDLAGLDRAEIISLLGATTGPALHALARGIDDRVVAERGEAKSVSAETTFAKDLLTKREIKVALAATGEAAHRRLLRDGRGARTVIAKFRKADMSAVTRSTTLAYATTSLSVLLAAAQRVAVDPAEIGAIRLVGVGFAGLSSQQQTVLFPDLDLAVPVEQDGAGGWASSQDDMGAEPAPPPEPELTFDAGADVRHPDYGHGWVQGSGQGVVTVRFETRTSGPGRVQTFAVADPSLTAGDPSDSLDWQGWSADPPDSPVEHFAENLA
ncbi:DNA polymerase IV [Tomitella biformata]|uniref:DNA polymerase IV n=1 Tax=Tomitella biformata TaxID=630403 RepID=UPI000464F8DC|nr:DNA polymerase IV [Tomitella biformata]